MVITFNNYAITRSALKKISFLSFRLPSVSFLPLCQQQQQYQQGNINQQQQQSINQFSYLLPTLAMSEMSSGNAFDETEENGWQNADAGENNFISNSYSLQEREGKKSENSFQSMSTIQSSTSQAESSSDVELFIEEVGI